MSSRHLALMRRLGALALLVLGLALVLRSQHEDRYCSRTTTSGGATTTVTTACHRLTPTDLPVVAWGLLVLALIAPDLSEASFGGVSLKRKLDQVNDNLAAGFATLNNTVQSFRMSGGQFIAGDLINQTLPAASNSAETLEAIGSGFNESRGVAASVGLDDVPAVTITRLFAANHLIDLINAHPPDTLGGATLQIYQAVDDLALPLLRDDELDPMALGFRRGEGVVGKCLDTHAVETAKGARLQQGLDGLAADRRDSYADITSVTAVPLNNAAGRLIGVLSATSRDAAVDVTRAAAQNALRELASPVSRILVDLYGFDDDTP